MLRKSRGHPRTRFPRHSGIYRSDVSFQPVNPARVPPPVGRPRSRVIGRDGRCTPCPSFAMSSGRLILDRVARQQSPSPLHRHHQHKTIAGSMGTNYHRTVTSVLTACLSPGGHPTMAASSVLRSPFYEPHIPIPRPCPYAGRCFSTSRPFHSRPCITGRMGPPNASLLRGFLPRLVPR